VDARPHVSWDHESVARRADPGHPRVRGVRKGGGPRLGVTVPATPMWGVSRGCAAWPATSPDPENPLRAGIEGGGGAVVGTHAVGRPRTTSPGGSPCDGWGRHVTRRVGFLAVVAPHPTGRRPLSGRGPARTGAPPSNFQPGPRAGTQPSRCGRGRLDLTWGWALPTWLS